jgi:hypothetical protein
MIAGHVANPTNAFTIVGAHPVMTAFTTATADTVGFIFIPVVIKYRTAPTTGAVLGSMFIPVVAE